MSDLVERLRKLAERERPYGSLPDTLDEAAAEIESLRFQLNGVLKMRNEAEAENERLRAALREHACWCVCVCMDAKVNYGEIDTPDTCKYGRATAALAQEKKG